MTLWVQYGLKAPFKMYREIHGQMAQLVARIPCKDEVIGSTPVLSRINHLFFSFLFFKFLSYFFAPIFAFSPFGHFERAPARARALTHFNLRRVSISIFFFFFGF